MTQSGPRLVDLQVIIDPRGHLGVAQYGDHVPFQIKRVFYQYKMSDGVPRGGHAHRALEQFMIGLHGSFDVSTIFQDETRSFRLDRPSLGLYLPPMSWVDFASHSDGGLCLVLASEIYVEADYIRDKTEFNRLSSRSIKR